MTKFQFSPTMQRRMTIDKYYKMIDNENYPYRTNDNQLEYGFGQLDNIMFVGRDPAKLSNRSAGESKFDLLFKQLLDEVGMTLEEHYFTNILKTHLPKGIILKFNDLEVMKEHLNFEVKYVDPILLVALGDDVASFLSIKKKNFFAVMNFGDKRVMSIAISHPSSIRYGNARSTILDELHLINTYYKHLRK